MLAPDDALRACVSTVAGGRCGESLQEYLLEQLIEEAQTPTLGEVVSAWRRMTATGAIDDRRADLAIGDL